MYCQCPACLTVYALDAPTLASAHGMASCGRCGSRFDILDTLCAQLPATPFRLLPASGDTLELPTLETAVYRPAVETGAGAAEAPAAAPSFAAHPRPRADRGWIAACVLLSLLLLAQAGWIARARLIADPHAGPWLQRGCAALGCRLPLVARPGRLRVLAREVRADPRRAGVLEISLTLRNEAGFAQPYPVIALRLSDAAGKLLGLRRFRPAEYLADAAVRRRGLASGDSAAVLIEVVNPGGAAQGFRLDFE